MGMIDREKVIKGLEHCRKTACESCPYNATDVKNSNPICLINEMLSDALALLKELQEQIDKLIEESASNAEMAEGMKELLKEQESIIPWLSELMLSTNDEPIKPSEVIRRIEEGGLKRFAEEDGQ